MGSQIYIARITELMDKVFETNKSNKLGRARGILMDANFRPSGFPRGESKSET